MKKLFSFSERLKHLPRTGWVMRGITQPETVASHSWQMALMALALSDIADNKYDYNKVIKLCLCHDLAESVVGDITPCEKEYADKAPKEIKAMQHIAKEGNVPSLLSLFAEYEENKTPEAQLAHDLDKLDMYVQSLDYEQKYPQKNLNEFRISAVKGIKTPLGLALLQHIKNDGNDKFSPNGE